MHDFARPKPGTLAVGCGAARASSRRSAGKVSPKKPSDPARNNRRRCHANDRPRSPSVPKSKGSSATAHLPDAQAPHAGDSPFAEQQIRTEYIKVSCCGQIAPILKGRDGLARCLFVSCRVSSQFPSRVFFEEAVRDVSDHVSQHHKDDS
jgi:hypothetical protein